MTRSARMTVARVLIVVACLVLAVAIPIVVACQTPVPTPRVDQLPVTQTPAPTVIILTPVPSPAPAQPDPLASVGAWLGTNWPAVLVVLVLVLYAALRVQQVGTRQTILQLIFFAEKWMGSEDGKAKMKFVLSRLPQLLGGWPWRLLCLTAAFKNMTPEAYAESVVQAIFDAAKGALVVVIVPTPASEVKTV